MNPTSTSDDRKTKGRRGGLPINLDPFWVNSAQRVSPPRPHGRQQPFTPLLYQMILKINNPVTLVVTKGYRIEKLPRRYPTAAQRRLLSWPPRRPHCSIGA